MKAKFYSLIAILSFCASLSGQTYVDVSYGPAYINQIFYSLDGDEKKIVDPLTWDIAFTTIGQQDAGIHLNEAAASGGGQLELYLAPTTDFSASVTVGDLGNPLFNDEASWDFGAFNNPRDPSNFTDLGWGTYSPMTNSITGDRVFVLKRRDDTYLKLMVESLVGSTYTVRWANLDGSNEETFTVDKAGHPDSPLAYYSFANGEINTVPATWDLLFTRYVTPLDYGGMSIDYLLTGTLSGYGVEVAQANDVDPSAVTYDDYRDSLSNALDVIGYDWKEFTGMGWSLPADRAYFVKTATGDIWKIIFDDFEGSGTGNVVFTKELVGTTSSIENPVVITEIALSPNPANMETYLSYSTVQSGEVAWRLFNSLGALVASNTQYRPAGFYTETIDLQDLPRGSYFLELQTQGDQLTKKLQRF